jgi:hypothetical protein
MLKWLNPKRWLAKNSGEGRMDKKLFIERMLESENLTDELEDRDANWLLDWGIGNLDALLSGINDPESAGLKVNHLMALMRKINRIAGGYAKKSTEDLAEELKALQELCIEAFGGIDRPMESGDSQTFEKKAANLAGMTPRQVVETLCLACGVPDGNKK